MRTLNDIFLPFTIPDISSADEIYIPAPDGGQIIKILAVIDGAITVADATLTTKVNGTTIGASYELTVPYSGSAAGDVNEIDVPRGVQAATVKEGDAISVATDGGSSTARECRVIVVLRR